MSAHTCQQPTHGCFRCELNIDELRGAWSDAVVMLANVTAGNEPLSDGWTLAELKAEVEEMGAALQQWDAVEAEVAAHRMVGSDHRPSCSCGKWEAPLGQSIFRSFDAHLIAAAQEQK